MSDYSTKRLACYTAHNSTKKTVNETLPCMISWVGASKIRVFKGGKVNEQTGGGARGSIQMFSAGSRKRFMRKLAEVNKDAKPIFVTMTFPDEYYDKLSSPAHWKVVLKRFFQAHRRDYPAGGIVWKEELQIRKSGLYTGVLFPHFHMLVYGIDNVHKYREWVASVWWRSAGKLSQSHLRAGTSVTATTGGKRLMIYISKYMAKVDNNIAPGGIGRVWGVVEPENIPFVRAILTQLTTKEAVQLLRYMRRYAGFRGKDYSSLTVFLDADFWFYNLGRILYPD